MIDWKQELNINNVIEIRTKTNVYFGCGAIQKIHGIAQIYSQRGIDKVIVVSGKNSYKTTGAWAIVEKALKTNNIQYINYDKVTPNPTTDTVDEATKIARDFDAKAVISIGGGSPIDTGKSVAILLKYPNETGSSLYEFKFNPTKAVPIIAINLTHGTGSETNRFAVATILDKGYKPAIAYDCIYPEFAIDDPDLMIRLSPNQTRYVSIDAVNHVIEAATSTVASPYSVTLARQVIELVAQYLPKAIEDPMYKEARYYLCYAAMVAGVCFDNGLLHYTHALEHPLSAIKPDLSHGLGLAIILPAVIKNIYSVKSQTLNYILEPIVKNINDPEIAANGVYEWLRSVDVPNKLTDEGFNKNDVKKLTELAFTTPSLDGLLSLAPTKATKEAVETIYRESL